MVEAEAGGSRAVLSLVGVGLVALAVGTTTFLLSGPLGPLGALLFVGPGIATLTGVWLVHRSGLPTGRYNRIGGWMAGSAAALAVVALLMILTPAISIDNPPFATTLAVGVGALGGLVAGVNEARAIVRAEREARQRVATTMAEEQRERLEWVNHLLRHDILNDVTVVRARADAIAGEHGEGPHVRAIHQQVDAVTELIGNVRAFLESVETDEPLSAVDLAAVVEREAESLRSAYPDATVTVDLPDEVRVVADDLVGSVFSNLFRSAVVHADSETPTVRVTATVADGSVTVRVADDGPGIPDHVRKRAFEAAEGSDHGFGLYLVGTLAERYGGEVAIESTGADGTTVAVTLPLAGAGTPEASDTPGSRRPAVNRAS